jgi:hypothetical protein
MFCGIMVSVGHSTDFLQTQSDIEATASNLRYRAAHSAIGANKGEVAGRIQSKDVSGGRFNHVGGEYVHTELATRGLHLVPADARFRGGGGFSRPVLLSLRRPYTGRPPETSRHNLSSARVSVASPTCPGPSRYITEAVCARSERWITNPFRDGERGAPLQRGAPRPPALRCLLRIESRCERSLAVDTRKRSHSEFRRTSAKTPPCLRENAKMPSRFYRISLGVVLPDRRGHEWKLAFH